MRFVGAGAGVRAARVTLAIASLALLASACSGSSASGSGSASGTITVGVVPGVDNAPLRVAVNDGLFSAHGLNVTIQTYPSLRPEFQALTSGHIDVAAGDYADFFYEQATKGASLHLIADGYDATSNLMEVLTRAGSAITTPAGLAGKTVATPQAQLIPPNQGSSYMTDNAPFNMETLATESVLQSDGVSPSSVTWKPTPSQDMISELASGQVSAILATEPLILQAQSQLGAVELLDSCSGETANLPLSGYFSLASYNQAHASDVAAFQAALSTAQASSAMRGPVQSVLPSFAGINAQDAALVTLGTYPTFLNVGQVQRVAGLMYDSGMISNPLSVTSMLSG